LTKYAFVLLCIGAVLGIDDRHSVMVQWRESIRRQPARGQHVPFSGLVPAHTPGKSPVFPAVGMEGTGETDWLPEQRGFEPLVPPRGATLLKRRRIGSNSARKSGPDAGGVRPLPA
jgi:hypothetical protein